MTKEKASYKDEIGEHMNTSTLPLARKSSVALSQQEVKQTLVSDVGIDVTDLILFLEDGETTLELLAGRTLSARCSVD